MDSVSAELNTPNGYGNHYFKGYVFNAPNSYKLTGKGVYSGNLQNYMNFKKGSNFVNISIDKYSDKYNKKTMDGFSYFTWDGQDLYKTTISGVDGFYNEQNGVKTFVFASADDVIYLQTKGVDISNVISNIVQEDSSHSSYDEYGYDDDLDYESDAYDDSFDDSFDDAAYYNYNW